MSILLCGAAAMAASGMPAQLAAQDLPAAALPSPSLTPLPEVAPTEPAPEPVVAKPAPAPVEASPTPQLPAPTAVAPVIVAVDEKDKVGPKVGTVAVGVLGGLAGAAVAGPVGKFAGGFVGKRIARGLFGDKDKVPELTVVQAAGAPSAEAAGQPAVAAPASAPALKE